MTATAFSSRPALVAAMAAGLLAAAGTRAEVVVFSVDPARSTLQLRGSVAKNGLNLLLNPQRDGALHTAASGQLRVELTPDAIRFADHDDDAAVGLTLADSGVWQPDWFGAEGAAPACWGALAGANLGFIRIAGLAAGRFWGFTVTSTN
ncbi:MAG TPA: hypothetical protein PKE47_16965, partial [Verrucomicrobiota bacterium]|nr:hypothetical protein [Verrucomicrobiota bacterium]